MTFRFVKPRAILPVLFLATTFLYSQEPPQTTPQTATTPQQVTPQPLPAADTSKPAEDQPEDLYEGLKRVMAVKQKEWAAMHNSLSEASRKLSPCSPRMTSLLKGARESAGEAVKASTKYFQRWGESIRQQVDEEKRFAAEAAANFENNKALLDNVIQEGESIRRRKEQLESALKETDSKEVRETLANLEKMYNTNRKNLEDAVKSGDQITGLSKVTREQLAAKEALLGQIQSYEVTEQRKWQAYYDFVEAELKKRCATVQQPSDPFSIPSLSLPAEKAKPAGKK